MKLKVWSVLALLCLALPVFVSCSDDDDDDPVVTGNVTGTYSGTLNATVMATDCPMDGEYQLSILSQKDEDLVTVVLPQCSFTTPGMPTAQTIPSVTVVDVDVDTYSDGYTIKADEFNVTMDGVSYTGSINGTVSGGVAKINYSMVPGKMPMQINFTFNGTQN